MKMYWSIWRSGRKTKNKTKNKMKFKIKSANWIQITSNQANMSLINLDCLNILSQIKYLQFVAHLQIKVDLLLMHLLVEEKKQTNKRLNTLVCGEESSVQFWFISTCDELSFIFMDRSNRVWSKCNKHEKQNWWIKMAYIYDLSPITTEGVGCDFSLS